MLLSEILFYPLPANVRLVGFVLSFIRFNYSFYFYFIMSFFYKSPDRVVSDLSEDTSLLCHEVDSEGNSKTILKSMDSILEPLSLLSYTDFQLSELIRNGVSYSSLNISDDMRLGHEQDFVAFEERYKSLESKIFETVESKQN